MFKKIIVILLLLLLIQNCSDSPTGNDDDVEEMNFSGKLRIALLNDASVNTTRNRLNGLLANSDAIDSLGIGEFTITEISISDVVDSLSNFDLICFPTVWGNASFIDSINAYGAAILEFVENGGGLFIDQANANITLNFLPDPFTLDLSWTSNADISRVIVDSTHYITQGLEPEDLPFPFDEVVGTLPAVYKVLVKRGLNDAPSLFVTNHGEGRILFTMGNPGTSPTYNYSDEAYYRMLMWVAP